MKRTRSSWCGMMSRCYWKKHTAYHKYGGRGILVCKEMKTFEGFVKIMGIRPEGKSLGRINNNQGYSPKNCRWETPTQQTRNRSNNRRLKVFGKALTSAEWAEIFGVDRKTIDKRLQRGVPIKRAVTMPLGPSRWDKKRKRHENNNHIADGVRRLLSMYSE